MRDRFLIAACLLGYWRSLSCNLVTHWYVLVRTMWKIIYQTMKTYFITLSLIAWSGQEEKKWKIKETAGRNFHTNQFLCRWKTINSKFINRFLTKSLWKKANKTYRTGDTRKQIFLLIHLTCGDYPCNLLLILETELWAWASKYLRIV